MNKSYMSGDEKISTLKQVEKAKTHAINTIPGTVYNWEGTPKSQLLSEEQRVQITQLIPQIGSPNHLAPKANRTCIHESHRITKNKQSLRDTEGFVDIHLGKVQRQQAKIPISQFLPGWNKRAYFPCQRDWLLINVHLSANYNPPLGTLRGLGILSITGSH